MQLSWYLRKARQVLGDVPAETKVESVSNAIRLILILKVLLVIIVPVLNDVHSSTLPQNLVKDKHALKKS